MLGLLAALSFMRNDTTDAVRLAVIRACTGAVIYHMFYCVGQIPLEWCRGKESRNAAV
jgi:hypothetical protein